ncbi:MAG: hypothetical protein LBO66_05040 [Deltaproteobacteria bacterium]|jgi:uncharacterized membrane protein|nr:hypothetical protein [Deltaproteobacteria bacterium]
MANEYQSSPIRPDVATSAPVFDPADIERNKVVACLSYLGILFLIPLFAAKDSPFARAHVNQGFLLFLYFIGLSVVFGILMQLSFGLAVAVLSIGNIVGSVIAIWRLIVCLQGKFLPIPVIGGKTLIK